VVNEQDASLSATGLSQAEPEVSALRASIPSATTLGLPFPWKLKAGKRIGDRFFFFSVSPLTLAVGFEFLRDGFVLLLGPMNIGWASISSFNRRADEEDRKLAQAIASAIEARSDATGTGAAEGESAPEGDAQKGSQ
jgi:hypothetical protein